MINSIQLWHTHARPNPTDKDFSVQLGCHFEEVAEMVETLRFHVHGHESCDGEMTMLFTGLKLFADSLKSGEAVATVAATNRKALLDSIADQIVTAVGVGHCARMAVATACTTVNASNWSKFDSDGQPIFDANGKIAKGPNYAPPDLEGMY